MRRCDACLATCDIVSEVRDPRCRVCGFLLRPVTTGVSSYRHFLRPVPVQCDVAEATDEAILMYWLRWSEGTIEETCKDQPPKLVEAFYMLRRHELLHQLASMSRDDDRREAVTRDAHRYSAAVTFFIHHPSLSCTPLLHHFGRTQSHVLLEAGALAFRAVIAEAGGSAALLQSREHLERVVAVMQPIVHGVERIVQASVMRHVMSCKDKDELAIAVMQCGIMDLCRMCVEWCSCRLHCMERRVTDGDIPLTGLSAAASASHFTTNDCSDTERISAANGALDGCNASVVVAHFDFIGRLIQTVRCINATSRASLAPHRATVSLLVAEVRSSVDAMMPPGVASMLSPVTPLSFAGGGVATFHTSFTSAGCVDMSGRHGQCDLTAMPLTEDDVGFLTLPSGLRVTLSAFVKQYVTRLLDKAA